MRNHLFYRNIRAADHLDAFLISAASSLLLIRLLLKLSHYPSIGGSNFHIAHMLYGGLLMAAALVFTISFIGARVQRIGAIVGGIGFGVFIDELGKFITRDNNYFFRPTIGIIYAIFIIMYLVFNFLGRTERLTKREYELNALDQFEEAVLHDMDRLEKKRILELLDKADQTSPVVQELRTLLERIDTVPTPRPRFFQRTLADISHLYHKFWRQRTSNGLIGGLFVAEAVIFLFAVLGTLAANFSSIDEFILQTDYAQALIVGQLASSLVAAGFAIAGAYKLTTDRLQAFEYFRRATMVNLLLTEFFIFSRLQLGAIPSFTLNLVLLLALRYSIFQEQRQPRTA